MQCGLAEYFVLREEYFRLSSCILSILSLEMPKLRGSHQRYGGEHC